MRLVYFITHPDVVINPAIPPSKWPLSQQGQERMRRLSTRPEMNNISSIYCSTEQKAVAGAEILARSLSINYQKIAELSEVDRSSTGYLLLDDLRTTIDMFFTNPDQSSRGWETANHAQRRIVGAVETVIRNDKCTQDMAIVSHGLVGTLYLCHLKGVQISQQERQPGKNGGHFYCFDTQSRLLLHGWKSIESEW